MELRPGVEITVAAGVFRGTSGRVVSVGDGVATVSLDVLGRTVTVPAMPVGDLEAPGARRVEEGLRTLEHAAALVRRECYAAWWHRAPAGADPAAEYAAFDAFASAREAGLAAELDRATAELQALGGATLAELAAALDAARDRVVAVFAWLDGAPDAGPTDPDERGRWLAAADARRARAEDAAEAAGQAITRPTRGRA